MDLTVAAERVTNAWIMVDTILNRSTRATVGHRASVLPGRNVMA
jgi:alkaline phosphatase D